MRQPFAVLLLANAVLICGSIARAETLEQIISREHPDFRNATATFDVGRDGQVYFASNGRDNTGYAIRMQRDGSQRFAGSIVYSLGNVTANRDGIVASANSHFAHQVTLYNSDFEKRFTVNDFLVNDAVGWDAPAHVEAGDSGDFYGVDQHRDRVLRISPQGKVLRAYVVPRDPEGNSGLVQDFRASEEEQAFYLLTRAGNLRAIGFDGREKWRVTIPGLGWNSGGFDVADDGTIYAIGMYDRAVQKISPTGEIVGTVAIQAGDLQPQAGMPGWNGLQIFADEVLLRRTHPTEMFQRYSISTGERLSVATIDFERLAVTLPSHIWTAGETVPLNIEFASGTHTTQPRWRVWLRPLNSVEYRELDVQQKGVLVPADIAGLFQIKVSPEVQPWERGQPSEYLVRTWIEIRPRNCRGSISLLTPHQRTFYERGEEIPISLLVRSSQPEEFRLELQLSRGSANHGIHPSAAISGGQVIATTEVNVQPGAIAAIRVPAELTRALAPGSYRLHAAADGFTSANHTIIFGSGVQHDSVFRIRHGDYGPTYPSANSWNAPDVVLAHVDRERRLGFNWFVDRIGTPLQQGALEWDSDSAAQWQALSQRLQNDPLAVAPETLNIAPPFLQVLGAYSALGMQEMAILLMMDAGLPLGGPGFDARKPEQLEADIQKLTAAMLPYPGFRGWSWHANWWIYEQRGAKAAISAEQQASYEAALKQAQDTGKWDPVLEQVADRRLRFAVDAQDLFARAMRKVPGADRLKTASAGTYRNVEAYPPVSFQNVDEVDLQGQFEQIYIPYFPAHAVDFYRRPGKIVWGHPEVWNDSGTGGQILPDLFSMLMRDPDGIGTSGHVPPWRTAGIIDDPRVAHAGTASVYRALHHVLDKYGAWLRTLDVNDQVAIVASPRQFQVDEWLNRGVTGKHFSRLLEAYVNCMHAHHPASIVLVDDMQPDTLARYKAVLLVDRWIEFEPKLQDALDQAQAAGTQVFYDGTCRESLVSRYQPLGIAFNQFETDHHPASDDSAYYRFPRYVETNVPVLKEKLNAVATPAAKLTRPEVWITERVAGRGRYLFVVNNCRVPLTPSEMWRVDLHVASRLGVQEPLTFTQTAPAIYDVFAMREITGQQPIVADLRHLPARVYALLPARIASVHLRGPQSVAPGQLLQWQAQVHDNHGQTIDASIPLRFRLLTEDGAVIEERCLAAAAGEATGESISPLGLTGRAVVLEVAELISGKTTRLKLSVAPLPLPVALDHPKLVSSPASATNDGEEVPSSERGVETQFGPHVRDMVLIDGGRLAVLSTMNWDHNLYAVNTGTGQVVWREKIGHHFAYAPQSLENGVVVQGFDLNSAEGYFLTALNRDGKPRRRFGLYGLPRRLPHRFVPGLLNDRSAPLNNFAAATDGGWFASAGDLGLAVWDSAGKLLWKQDWWKEERHTARLAALDKNVLLVAAEQSITAYEARSSKVLWQHSWGVTGEVRKMVVSGDASTVAILHTQNGGRVDILRDGQPHASFVSDGEDLSINHKGSAITVLAGHQLKWFTADKGLQWVFTGDDVLRNVRLNPAGDRVAVASELGTLYVLDGRGDLLVRRDLQALAVPAWLPGGNLLLSTWMGQVLRLDNEYQEQFSVLLQTAEFDTATSLTVSSTIPTSTVTDWGNAEHEPWPLQPNLLAETGAIIRFVAEGSPHIQLVRPTDPLVDGHSTPQEPWLEWGDINWFAEMAPQTYLLLDTFRTRLRIDALTFVEDPEYPNSWMRDAHLEYWDSREERWVYVQPLLSNQAVHTHVLRHPIEAARVRIVLPRGFFGNLRLSEIVLHGQNLGASHPDVVQRRSVAVLFDDSEEFRGIYPYHDRWSLQLEGAFSGGRCLHVNADQTIAPAFVPPFGHAVPNWDFEIGENPEPGQYRWIQFAWKALTPEVKGAALELHGEGPSLRLLAGEAPGEPHVPSHRVADQVPGEWQTVRIDLWSITEKPLRLRSLYFAAAGAAVAFDQVLLGRSAADLEHFTRPQSPDTPSAQ